MQGAKRQCPNLSQLQLRKVLIEYGHMPAEEHPTIAALIEDRIGADLLENPMVQRLINENYDHHSRLGATPELHYFINHPDKAVRDILASLFHEHSDTFSSVWKL